MRRDFFGPDGDTTRESRSPARASDERFRHHELDVRDREGVGRLVDEVRPSLIVHCAAQPSHDLAARRPFDDFDVNAAGTLNLLEARARMPGVAVRLPVDEQGVWRRAERARARRARDALRLRRPRAARGNRRDLPDRRDDPQPVRRVEGCRRSPGPGVRALLRHAHGLLPRRLPHRVEPRERRAPWLPRVPRTVRPRRAHVPHLRLQGQAGPGQHPCLRRVRRGTRVRRDSPGRAPSTTSAAAARTPSRSSRRSSGSRSSPAGSSTVEYVDEPRRGDHICYISDLGRLRARLSGWSITVTLDDIFGDLVRPPHEARSRHRRRRLHRIAPG